jgi:hypothetical protein
MTSGSKNVIVKNIVYCTTGLNFTKKLTYKAMQITQNISVISTVKLRKKLVRRHPPPASSADLKARCVNINLSLIDQRLINRNFFLAHIMLPQYMLFGLALCAFIYKSRKSNVNNFTFF